MIIEGINTGVGEHEYIFPVESMQTAFRPQKDEVFMANQREVVRNNNQILRVLRLYEEFQIDTEETLSQMIQIMTKPKH